MNLFARLLSVAVFVSPLTTVAQVSAATPATPPPAGTDSHEVPLRQALENVARAAGARLKVIGSVSEDAWVPARVAEAAPERLLERLLSGGSYALQYDSDGRLAVIHVLSGSPREYRHSPSYSPAASLPAPRESRTGPAATRFAPLHPRKVTAPELIGRPTVDVEEEEPDGSPAPSDIEQMTEQLRREEERRRTAARFKANVHVTEAELVDVTDEPPPDEGSVDQDGTRGEMEMPPHGVTPEEEPGATDARGDHASS